jgi:hypothetical protein
MSFIPLGILAAAGAGGGGSFESIAKVVSVGGESSLSFTSIPSTYKHLQIRGIGKANFPSVASLWTTLNFNSDTTAANYANHQLTGDGSAVSASGATATGAIQVSSLVSNDGSETNIFSAFIIDVADYSSTTKNKTVRSFSGNERNTTPSLIELSSGLWINTAAVTSITFNRPGFTFISGTTFSLYGIKG